MIKHGKMIDSTVTLWDLFVGDWPIKPQECILPEIQGSSPQILWLIYKQFTKLCIDKIVVGSSRFAYVNASKHKVCLIFYLPITEHLLCNILYARCIYTRKDFLKKLEYGHCSSH